MSQAVSLSLHSTETKWGFDTSGRHSHNTKKEHMHLYGSLLLYLDFLMLFFNKTFEPLFIALVRSVQHPPEE